MFKGIKKAWKNIYKKIVTCWERKEGRKEREKEGRGREGRKYVCVILHVRMVLANIDIKIPWIINIKSSI